MSKQGSSNYTITFNGIEITPLSQLTEMEKSTRVMPDITVKMWLGRDSLALLESLWTQHIESGWLTSTGETLDAWVRVLGDYEIEREFGESDQSLRVRLDNHLEEKYDEV